MPFSPQDILWGMGLPLMVAGLGCVLLYRILPPDHAVRWIASVCLIGGFLTGYFAIGVGSWPPDRHWHWIPVAILPSLIFGPLPREMRLGHLIGGLLFLIPCAVAVWLLVPQWSHLEPGPVFRMIGWGLLLWLVMSALEPLADRIPATTFTALLTGTLFCGAAVIVQGDVLVTSQILLTAAFCMAGLHLGSWTFDRETRLVGIACPFVLLLGGLISIGQVQTFSSVPVASYVLVLLAPLTVWLTQFGPLSRWEAMAKTAAILGLPAATCLAAILLAEWFSPSFGDLQ